MCQHPTAFSRWDALTTAHPQVDLGLELEQLFKRGSEPHLPGTEVDEQCGLVLDCDDSAKAMRVVAYPIPHGEFLDRRGRSGLEGTRGQMAPTRG
jgi:hypothetical protein